MIIEAVIRARRRDLAGIEIRRVLPTRERRMVGPFIFLDHLGPMTFAPGEGIDVPPHPHIHLATVTYLFEGSLRHRDSLGFTQDIRPGQINWMHAGTGIVHSERTGTDERRRASSIHALQLWVALPTASEDTPPAFTHYPESSLPGWDEHGTRGRVLVGSHGGLVSPVETASPTLYADLALDDGASIDLEEAEELAMYIVSGSVEAGGRAFGESDLVVFGSGTGTFGRVTGLEGGARLVLLGGESLDGERHIWWNFVSSSRGRIDRAREDWANGRFSPVPGDGERTEAPPA